MLPYSKHWKAGELTDAERRSTEMRAANLRMLHQQEQGEMYRYAMNLLRKAKEFSELERLVAETVIDTIENLRKKDWKCSLCRDYKRSRA